MEKSKTIFLLLALLGVFFWLGVQMGPAIVKDATPGKADSVRHWRDKYNQEHAVAVHNQLVYRTAMETMRDTIESISDRLNIAPKQVEGHQHITGKSAGTYMGNLWPAAGGMTFDISTNFKRLTGRIDSNTIIIHDTGLVSVDINAYWQRKKGLFGIRYGRKQHFVDITSADTTLHFTGVTSWEIKSRRPDRFGVGPFVGFAADGRFCYGVGVMYAIVRF